MDHETEGTDGEGAGKREVVAYTALKAADAVDRARRAADRAAGRDELKERLDAQARLALAAGRADPDTRLSIEASMMIFDGIPENTRRTHKTQWWKFVSWCGETGREHLPATPQTCVEWIVELGRRKGRYGRPTAPESIRTSLKTIAAAHRRAKRPEIDNRGNPLYGYISPTKHPDVQTALKGYTRNWLKAGHRPDTAHALTKREITSMIATCDVRTPMGLCDATLLAVGYDLGGRRVELANLDIIDIGFQVRDWQRITTEDYMSVTITMSKTDQRGEGAEVLLFAHSAARAATCPVRLSRRWIGRQAEDGFVDGAMFKVVRTGGKPRADGQPKTGKILPARIDGNRVALVVERTARLAGLTGGAGKRKHIVPQSLRAGAATEAGAGGAQASEINDHFRWSQNGTTGNRYARLGHRRSANPMRRAWAAEEEQNVGD